MKSNTERRTVFRGQWVNEDGETAFMRAAESAISSSCGVVSHGADPMIATGQLMRCRSLRYRLGGRPGPTSGQEAANARP